MCISGCKSTFLDFMILYSPLLCCLDTLLKHFLMVSVLHLLVHPATCLFNNLSEYRIQHGIIVPLYVTSNYSTRIFYRGVSGFANDCPCGVWCRGLTTCLLNVGPLFGNWLLNNSWAVGLTKWIVTLTFFLHFDICNHIYLNTLYEFWALSLRLK